jgi:hypothetical protein
LSINSTYFTTFTLSISSIIKKQTMWAAKYVTSAVVGETIPEAVKGKTFYDLQAPLPGSKGTFDFVSISSLVDL